MALALASALASYLNLALLWRSPMGPISISYAIPIKSQDKIDPVTFQPADDTERPVHLPGSCETCVVAAALSGAAQPRDS